MDLQWILATLMAQVPIVVVCLAGIVWTLLRLDQQPRVGMFVLAGLGLYAVLGVSQIILQGPLQQVLSQVFGQDQAMSNLRLHFAVINFAFNVLRALSLGLLVYGAFVDRPVVAMVAPQQPMR